LGGVEVLGPVGPGILDRAGPRRDAEAVMPGRQGGVKGGAPRERVGPGLPDELLVDRDVDLPPVPGDELELEADADVGVAADRECELGLLPTDDVAHRSRCPPWRGAV